MFKPGKTKQNQEPQPLGMQKLRVGGQNRND